MSVSHQEMERLLKSLGCRSVHVIKKVLEFMLPGTKEPFYLHRENQMPQIVVRPALVVFVDELKLINGVHAKEPYYHNADMVRFPKRMNDGKTDVHFGLAFEFDNALSVEKFINKFIGIVTS